MIIAQVSCLRFNLDRMRHTVNYAQLSAGIQKHSPEELHRTMPAVAVADLGTAVSRLRTLVREYLAKCYWHPDPKDFEFRVVYATVEDGCVWLPPCTSPAGTFPA
jgi:hypothetical protein